MALQLMAIAYFILCHKNPEHIIRLIERLRDEGSFFVVHVDKRASEDVFSALRDFAFNTTNVYFSKRSRCFWGGFGIVQATINCIQRTLELNRCFDYSFLLSGQDYPIKTNAEIKSFLAQHNKQEFIESFSLAEPNRWSNHGGYYKAMNRVQFWTIFIRSKHFHLKWKRKFPFGWQPHGGSQWWCLSRECIFYIDSFIREHPSLVWYFKRVFIPDETFFQSILSNSPFRNKIVSDDLRYIDWANPNPNFPKTLEDDDFGKLKATSKLFARKFDVYTSKELLKKIDSELLNS